MRWFRDSHGQVLRVELKTNTVNCLGDQYRYGFLYPHSSDSSGVKAAAQPQAQIGPSGGLCWWIIVRVPSRSKVLLTSMGKDMRGRSSSLDILYCEVRVA